MGRYSDYDAFAWIYNKYWGSLFVRGFFHVIERLFLKHIPPNSHILDLCSGTGQLAQALIERGYRMTGINGSAEMIHYARKNAPMAKFIVSAARSFKVVRSFHGALSTFDSLNHIMSLKDLEKVFRRVHSSLRRESIFMFDLNMKEGYEARWRGADTIVNEENVIVTRASFDPKKMMGQYDVTIFLLKKSRWYRSDVKLTQRCYDEVEILSALKSSGFEEINVYDAQSDLEIAQVGRKFFVCRT